MAVSASKSPGPAPVWLASPCALLGLAAPFLRAADIERDEQRTLDGKGAVKHRESTIWDVTPLQTGMYRRLVQRDDKPLLAKEDRDMDEVVAGFDLRLLPDEEIDGVPVWVIDGSPRAGYKFTKSQFARVVSSGEEPAAYSPAILPGRVLP
jgi:hypothetical protein